MLWGPKMDGLDPASTSLISKISGASYLYYSWPSWVIDSNATSVITHGTSHHTIKKTDLLYLWVDHQGGVIKEPDEQLISQFGVCAGARPKVFPGLNWFSIQLSDNTQFTGYSNKPWDNDKTDNVHHLKGTWSDKEGKLSWIRNATVKIDTFWTSQESKLNFGVDYTIDLGVHGKYKLKSIYDDQRIIQEGMEDYEGGCDVYRHDNLTTIIGMGNLECVGWASASQRIDFLSPYLNLSNGERNI